MPLNLSHGKWKTLKEIDETVTGAKRAANRAVRTLNESCPTPYATKGGEHIDRRIDRASVTAYSSCGAK